MTATLRKPVSPRRRFSRRSPSSTPSSSGVVLALILTCQLMIVLDVSIVITSLPKIHSALDFSPTSLSWVQNAYTLTFGGLLLLGARMGDILGRRRMLVAGLTLFTASSLAGGLAQSSEWLLIARGFQGIGAAIAAPSTLALLTVTFREGPARLKAIAAYSGVSAGGGSIGLIVGGLLTDLISWRWGLFINVPIGIALITLAPRYLPETERHRGRFDLAGAITSTVGMTTLVYGFVRAASDGWGERGTLFAFATAAVLLTSFLINETHAEQPITPLRLFASRERSGAYLSRLLLVGGNFSAFFFLTQYLQGVLGFSALEAGLAFLPMTLTMFAAIRMVPRITERVGNSTLLIGGLFGAFLGMVWLSQISGDTSYFPQIAIPMMLFGAGTGIAFGPLTSAGLVGVEERDAGAASGLLNAAQQLGGSLGLGILITVFASASDGAANGQSAHAVAELASGVSSALTGSAAFLILAVAVSMFVTWLPGTETVRNAEPELAR